MKKSPSLFHVAVVTAAVTTLGLGAPCGVVFAQNAPTTNVVVTPAPPPPAPSAIPATVLPTGAAEVLKLHQGGIGKDIIISYIGNTMQSCHLNADAIIYLQTAGVPQEEIRALLQRDSEMQQHNQARMQYYAQQQQMPGPQNPPPPNGGYAPQPTMQGPPPAPAPAPAPSVTVIGSDYPDYYYGGYPYSYYGGPYGYWPPVVIGGWGWGWGHGGFRGGVGFRGGGFRGGFGGHGGGHR